MLSSLILIFVICLLFWFYFRSSYWSQLGIPEVRGLPLIGNLARVVLKRQPYFQLQEEIYNAGEGHPYIGMYNLTVPSLVIRDPELVEAILKDETRNFMDHGLHADPSDPLSLNMFYLKGALWKSVRSQLRFPFSTSGMKNVYPEVKKCVDDFLEEFDGKFNLRPTMDEFTCDVFAKAVFSVETNDGFVEAAKSVYDLSGLSSFRVLFRMFFPQTALAFGVKIVPQHIENFFRSALLNSKRKEGSFLDLLYQLKETDSEFNEDLLLGQFFIFILAGFETTASALTFIIYLLGKHPDVQEKARAHVKDITSRSGVSFESLKDMTYLDWVINEGLRLYTPVGSIVRLSERPFPLPGGGEAGGGILLPPNSVVVIPYLGLHRDPRIFPKPLEFCPERWGNGFKPTFFYPFGHGPRNCIEGLRLYTPVGSIVRLSERPFPLPGGGEAGGGILLPPNSVVVIPYLGLHRDPRIFPKPLEFCPERWGNGFKPTFFYPFGHGPRNCIGMKFALLEIKLFLASMLLKYLIKLDPGNVEPLEFEPTSLFLVPKHPIHIHTYPLNKDS